MLQLISLICIVLLSILVWHFQKRKKHPPGPLGFPFLGVLPLQIIGFIFGNSESEATDLELFKRNRAHYGPIWSVESGRQRIVVLCSWELISEAFLENAEIFSGRPNNSFYTMITHGKGIIINDGELWKGNRQMAIKALRDLGMGKKLLENRICEEGDNLIAYLEEMEGKNVDLMDALVKGISNVIIRLVFLERSAYDDPTFLQYVNNLRVLTHEDTEAKKISIFPVLFQTKMMRKFFPGVGRFLTASEGCCDFIKDKCEKRCQDETENSSPECVFDYFQQLRFNNSSELSVLERSEEIAYTMFDIFNAGIDTSSNLLSFCCLMLGKNASLQKDIRNELRIHVEHFGQLTLEMRKNCPKLLSFIDEVQRFCCLVPVVHHRVLRKFTFQGYHIDPSDIILGDMANIFSDPSLFEDPKMFNPFRFIDDSGTKYVQSKYLVPFGIGKRSCIGESIATMELFLFLGKIILRFKISLTEETERNFDIIVRGRSAIVHAPLHHLMNLDIY